MALKVLVVHPGPHFSVADVHWGLVRGLKEAGCEVASLNLDDRLDFYAAAHVEKNGEWRRAFEGTAAIHMAALGIEQACYRMWPDVVVLISGIFVTPETLGVLAKRPHHTVLWCTESPYEDDRQARNARYVNTVVLNDPTNLDDLRAVNPRTWYFPHSYDPSVHHPGPADPALACDFGFVGTGFPSRVEFFEQVDWGGIDARFGGNWLTLDDASPLHKLLIDDQASCMDNVDTARLYRSAKVGANLYRREHSDGGHADGWAMGPREVEMAACGQFFLRDPRGEGDEIFDGILPTFETPDEFGDQLRWWLAHDAVRETAARRAREAVADRTFVASARRLMQLVESPTRSA